jgi:hypothetical protein
MPKIIPCRYLMLITGLLLSSSIAIGATWNTNVDNRNWGANSNWTSPSTTPDAIGAEAIFGNVITGNRNVLLNRNFTVGKISFNDNNNYTLISNNSSVRNLTFDVASGNALIEINGANGNHTIGSAGTVEVILNDTLVVNHNTTGTFTLVAGMTGSGGLVKNGTGKMIYYKPPQSTTGFFTGNVTVNAGTLQLGIINDADPEIGASPQIFLNGGTLLYAGDNQIHDGAQILMHGGKWDLNGFSETVQSLTISSNSTIDMGNHSSTLSFLGGVNYNGGQLIIDNWSGSLSGGGTDQILFGTNVSSSFLQNVLWLDQNILGAIQLNTGEIVPIPEVQSLWMGFGLTMCSLHYYLRRKKKMTPSS